DRIANIDERHPSGDARYQRPTPAQGFRGGQGKAARVGRARFCGTRHCDGGLHTLAHALPPPDPRPGPALCLHGPARYPSWVVPHTPPHAALPASIFLPPTRSPPTTPPSSACSPLRATYARPARLG